MKKYYVYHMKGEDPNVSLRAIVENPAIFAYETFDPSTMEFSGVFVEAESTDRAHEIYNHPQENDVLVSCDEPRPTALKRQAYESQKRIQKSKSRIDHQKEINHLVLEIAKDFVGLAIQASALARHVWAIGSEQEQKDFTPEQIYARIMQRYASQLGLLKYQPGANDKAES